MRLKIMAFLSVGLFVAVAAHAGFLQPTAFPRTVDDLSFVDRVLLKSDGYEQFESEYDSDGNCVSGCAYAMPKWEDELAAMERWNRLAHQELIDDYGYTENESGELTPSDDDYFDDTETVDFPSGAYNPNVAYNQNCAIRKDSFKNTGVPYGNPLGYMACIHSPYGPRMLFGRKFHYGIDFHAAIGTPVYAPANGTVKTVFYMNKTCGNGLVIEHSNGYSTKYCHFNSVAVSRGDKVLLIRYLLSQNKIDGYQYFSLVKYNEYCEDIDSMGVDLSIVKTTVAGVVGYLLGRLIHEGGLLELIVSALVMNFIKIDIKADAYSIFKQSLWVLANNEYLDEDFYRYSF